MKHNILHFPKASVSLLEVSVTPSKKTANVIEVDFVAASKLAQEEAELVRLRHAFDLARADWPVEKAEFPEMNRRLFKY